MSDTPAVQVKSLVKDFRGAFGRGMIRAVNDVSFEIASGEVYGLIGPNGSGKSTTMKALLGLVTPTAGICSIFGRDSTKVDSRQEVGFLPEQYTKEDGQGFYARLPPDGQPVGASSVKIISPQEAAAGGIDLGAAPPQS